MFFATWFSRVTVLRHNTASILCIYFLHLAFPHTHILSTHALFSNCVWVLDMNARAVLDSTREEKQALREKYETEIDPNSIDPRFTLGGVVVPAADILHAMGQKHSRHMSMERIRNEHGSFHALMRGIGVHNVVSMGAYRNAVECLFRQKMLSVVFCTSTLAQVCVCLRG